MYVTQTGDIFKLLFLFTLCLYFTSVSLFFIVKHFVTSVNIYFLATYVFLYGEYFSEVLNAGL